MALSLEASPLRAKSLQQLRGILGRAIQAQDEVTQRQVVGALALLFGVVVRRRDPELLREMVRELGVTVEMGHARWILRIVQQDLPPELREWLDRRLQEIMHGSAEED